MCRLDVRHHQPLPIAQAEDAITEHGCQVARLYGLRPQNAVQGTAYVRLTDQLARFVPVAA